MIIVKLMGGLGNQLFQYAAGRTLAMKHHSNIKLDLSFLKTDAETHIKRDFELDVFNLNYSICSLVESERFTGKQFTRSLFPFLFRHSVLANEKSFEFNPDFFSLPANTYLNGFWQSEKYFQSIRKILLEELTINLPIPEKTEMVKKQILASNSVSLHVRRGDYVTNKAAQEFHGNLQLDYYLGAIAYLNNLYNDLNIFVFSDDIEWVKLNLKTSNTCIYVDFNNGKNSVFDLHLMSLCKHNIIANSSFSWWGAWLNDNKEKVVIAPKHWFANKNVNTKDLIPADWIKL